jgi:hypothetical protein
MKKSKSNFPLRIPADLDQKIREWMLRHPGVSKNSMICQALADWIAKE